jgi:uncharacterized Fe-S cluster protein YjdI/CDGSH-type Zn-finger protein
MAMDPVEAGTPRAKDVTRIYENEHVRVRWDASRCIHTGVCLHLLPSVFNVEVRPWIDLTGADPEEIEAAIRACPTGALRHDGDDAGLDADDGVTTIEVRPNGPLFVRGRIRLSGPGGRAGRDEVRLALCRCGASENKPFCDNSHRLVGFRDAGVIES